MLFLRPCQVPGVGRWIGLLGGRPPDRPPSLYHVMTRVMLGLTLFETACRSGQVSRASMEPTWALLSAAPIPLCHLLVQVSTPGLSRSLITKLTFLAEKTDTHELVVVHNQSFSVRTSQNVFNRHWYSIYHVKDESMCIGGLTPTQPLTPYPPSVWGCGGVLSKDV